MKLKKSEFSSELTRNILPFWMTRMSDPAGGFYGRIDGSGKLVPDAEKGAMGFYM